jgi:hypothetical protein
MGKITDKDKGWNRLQDLAKRLASEDVHVRVGVLDDGRAGSEDHGGITTGQLAVAMEFGTATIPARSWVGLTFDRARTEVQADMRTLLGHIVDGKITVDKALNVLGAKYSATVKNTVTQGEQIPPPNAPSTIARKLAKTREGASNAVRTLIDTGRMIGAVTWATFGGGK